MDNLTHSLAGWTLGQTGLKRKTRKGLAALILGANMPDIDVFFGWAAWEPLATHRGFTHGIVGVVIMPPLLAALLWLLDRWQVRRGAQFESGLTMHFGWLVALSYIGTLTHPLLDWQTTYSVQLLSPFSNLWFHNDALFIIDLWVLLIMGAAIWWSRRRERTGRAWRWPAQVATALVVGYISFNGALSASFAADASKRDADVVYASPPPVLFWQREVATRRGHALSWVKRDPIAGDSDAAGPVDNQLADPLVRQAIRLPEIRSFARWSTMPFAAVERRGCTARVSLGDARYGRTAQDNRLGRTVDVKTC